MPIIFLLLSLAFFVFVSPVPTSSDNATQEAPPAQTSLTKHYLRNGIVVINKETLATRFIPYRFAGDLDRRNALGAAA